MTMPWEDPPDPDELAYREVSPEARLFREDAEQEMAEIEHTRRVAEAFLNGSLDALRESTRVLWQSVQDRLTGRQESGKTGYSDPATRRPLP